MIGALLFVLVLRRWRLAIEVDIAALVAWLRGRWRQGWR
jgi:hypothetical protein